MMRCRTTRLFALIPWILFLFVLYQFRDRVKVYLFHQRKGEDRPQVMHLVAISCGRINYQGIKDIQKPFDQSLTMIKSAALFAKNPLRIHIFTEEDMRPLFEAELQSWPSLVRSRVTYTIQEIDYNKYLSKSMAKTWQKWYKPCGSFRLFLPMLLGSETDAAIYSDSDVVFIKPIDELWAQFKRFEPRQVVAVSPTAGHPLGGSKDNENFISHPTGLFQINTGVMVMNFTRMLSSDWILPDHESNKNVSPRLKKYDIDLLLDYYEKYKDKAEHDQKLLNIMFHFNPDLLRQLPCSWNFKNNFCMDDNNVCTEAESEQGAGAVHGITSAFFGDVNPTFRSLYLAFQKYDFQPDPTKHLLQAFLENLESSSAYSTFCGTKAHVITKPLTRSVDGLDGQV